MSESMSDLISLDAALGAWRVAVYERHPEALSDRVGALSRVYSRHRAELASYRAELERAAPTLESEADALQAALSAWHSALSRRMGEDAILDSFASLTWQAVLWNRHAMVMHGFWADSGYDVLPPLVGGEH